MELEYPLVLLCVCVMGAFSGEIHEIVTKLEKVVDFGLEFYPELNMDAILGYTIAEAQLVQAQAFSPQQDIGRLVDKISTLRSLRSLPNDSIKSKIFEHYLLNPKNWIANHSVRFPLMDLGIYATWTRDDLINDKKATFDGVESDQCLMEILHEHCYISPFCHKMMLAPRIDHGYLLSHRLLYLQVARIKNCSMNYQNFLGYTHKFCSLMLKEAKTNEVLGFPTHDIFLEQVVLCGIEGFIEFLMENWRFLIRNWQTSHGCYEFFDKSNTKRSSNIISYDCSDHTTGLGAAALALNFKYLLQDNVS